MAKRARQLGTLLFQLWIVAGITRSIFAIDKMDLYELHHHFVDNSFTTRQYPCTEREAECLKHNKLLYERDGQCYTPREQGPCAAGKLFHADKAEAARLGGHLRGTCASGCERTWETPLAATGECMSKSEVANKICRSDLYLEPALDVFGQWVCEWTRLPCSIPNITRPPFFSSVSSQGICSLPTDMFRSQGINLFSNETADDHPLLLFFSDASYKEREFLCSQEEKECLQYGRLLHANGACYRPGEWARSCGPGHRFHLDKEEMKKENGHLIGTCSRICDEYSDEMSSNCSTFRGMMQICRWDWGMSTTEDVFGQIVCYCVPDRRTLPTFLESSATQSVSTSIPGRCRAPDFSKPLPSPQYDRTLTLGFQGPCSEEEFACLQKNLVLYDGACHSLRTRGPCEAGEELVLDKDALAHARLKPKCVPSKCPEGSLAMPINGECRTIEKAKSQLCPHQKVALDEFGGWQCDFSEDWPANLRSIIRHASNGTCELPRKYGIPGSHKVFVSAPSSFDSRILGKPGGPSLNGNLKSTLSEHVVNSSSGLDSISSGVNENELGH